MKYYPVFLKIANERCVVIGGGDVAERKVLRLLDAGARVDVVSKTLTPALERMKEKGDIRHIEEEYDEIFLDGAFLVIGATDKEDTNEKISKDGRAKGCLVNIVDDPDKCTVILPALFQRGNLSIAISTGGTSPAVAKKLKEEMEHLIGPEYETLLSIMETVRKKILMRGKPSEENKRIFDAIIHSDILQHIREKKWDEVRKLLQTLTGEDIEVEI